MADAAPAVTVPDVTGEPTCAFPESNSVNVTVPAFTCPPALVTVAERGTVWVLVLKMTDAGAAVVVVEAFTDNVCVLSLLARRFVVPL